MKTPLDLGLKIRDRIAIQFPLLDRNGTPSDSRIRQIEHRSEEIENYEVIFWHRLLKSIYQGPQQIECELTQKGDLQKGTGIETALFGRTDQQNNWELLKITEDNSIKLLSGEIKPRPINWKYFIKLPSDGFVEIGTKDNNTIFYIAIVEPDSLNKKIDEEVKVFIDLILEEANRVKGQLFNPIKEFEKEENIKLYLLSNVYLSNYLSAESMLSIAESHENDLRREFLRYDARTSDMHDEGKRMHIDQHMLTCGMYYGSAISYYFMALEGFVNIVFHAFLKKSSNDKELNIDQRFDLEQKLRLMNYLCKGFMEHSSMSPSIMSKFKTLKKYRNSLFHAKVEDSLRKLCFVEDGFIYNYDMDGYKDQFLPSHKIKLTIESVVEVKNTVDQIVISVLESMNPQTKALAEKYLLNTPLIPFVISDQGIVAMGSNTEQ